MFIAGYICRLFNTYACGLLEKINENSLYVSLLKGFLELRNVELDEDVVMYCRLFFPLVRGSIGRVRVTVPWSALYTKPCEICLENVHIICSTRWCLDNADQNCDLAKGKQKIVHLLETYQQESVIDGHHTHNSFLRRLKRVILRNTTIVLKNSMVRLEHTEGQTIAATLKFHNVTCIGVNSLGESAFLTSDSNEVHRSITFRGISLILGSPVHENSKRGEWRTTAREEWTRRLNDVVEQEAVSHGYIVKPFSGEVFCSFQHPERHICSGKFEVMHCNSLELNPFNIKNLADIVCPSQASCSGTKTTTTTTAETETGNNDGQSKNNEGCAMTPPATRPNRILPGSSTLWWKYAFQQVISRNRISVEKNAFNWNSYQNWKRQCEEYYKYFLLTLGAPWVLEHAVNIERANAAVRSLSLECLVQVRQQARYTLEQFRVTGRVVPRHYGDTTYNNYSEYTVAAVEVLRSSAGSSSVNLELSLSLRFTRLLCRMADSDMYADVDFRDLNLRWLYSGKPVYALLSASSVHLTLCSPDKKPLNFVDIVDGTGTGEGLAVSHLQRLGKKECLVTLGSLVLNFDKLIVEEVLERFLTIKRRTALGTSALHVGTNATTFPPVVSTRVSIRNIVLDLGEVQIALQDLDIIAAFAHCSALHISLANGSPFITANELSMTYMEAVAINVGNSHISGNLSNLYTLNNVLVDVLVSLGRPRRDLGVSSSDAVEYMHLYKVHFSFIAIDFGAECASLKMNELHIHLRRGECRTFNAKCVNMWCDDVLSDTSMSVVLYQGNNLQNSSSAVPFTYSEADTIVSVVFEDGIATVDTRFVALLEFLNDLAWIILFPPEEYTPKYRNSGLRSPSMKVTVSFSNMSFALFGEPSCPWSTPFSLSCDGQDGLVVELMLYRDTRMKMIITLGKRSSCYVDEIVLMYPSSSQEGTLQTIMEWIPPALSDLEPRYTTLVTFIYTTERSFTVHLPALQESMRQFNLPESPLYRLKSMGSRVHFGLAGSQHSTYRVPFWPTLNTVRITAKNTSLLYYPWGKPSPEHIAKGFNTQVMVNLLSCEGIWTYNCFNRHMSTEVTAAAARLPRVVQTGNQTSTANPPDAFLNSSVVGLEVRYDVVYDTQSQKETILFLIKGSRTAETSLIPTQAGKWEREAQINSQEPMVFSLEEVYHLGLIASTLVSQAMEGSTTTPATVCSRYERSIRMRIAPFVVLSRPFVVALVLWDGVDVVIQDGAYAMNLGVVSVLCDELLQVAYRRGTTTLWSYLHRMRKAAAILEATGNIETQEAAPIKLKKEIGMDAAVLSIGGVFLRLTEERLPPFLRQLAAVHTFLSSGVPRLPPMSRVPVAAGSTDRHASLTISFAEVHIGFAWKNRINGLHVEIHLLLLALTIMSDGAVNLGDGNVKLMWFNVTPPSEKVGPSVLVLREVDAVTVVSLLERISLATLRSNQGDLRMVLAPIRINLSFTTYLHLVELVQYHVTLEGDNNAELQREAAVLAGTTCNDAMAPTRTNPMGEISTQRTTRDLWLSSSPSSSSVSVSVSASAGGVKETVVSKDGGVSSGQRCLSLEITEVLLSVAGLEEGGESNSAKSSPVVRLCLSNITFRSLPDAVSFVVGEASCGCGIELQVLSIGGFKLDWPRAAPSEHMTPRMVCTVESMTVNVVAPNLLKCFDQLVKTPAEGIAHLHCDEMHLGKCGGDDGDSCNSSCCHKNDDDDDDDHHHHKMTVVTVDTCVWTLTHDMVLSRNRGSVLVFSNLKTNNISVEMNGYSILVEPPREVGSEIVVVVDKGISLTFSNGRFILPWLTSGNKQLHRIERLGEEVVLLPFMAMGEGSYVRCRNVKYTASLRCEQNEQSHLERHNTRRRRWQMHLAMRSVSLSLSSCSGQGGMQVNLAVDGGFYPRGGMIEQGEATLKDITVFTRTADITSAGMTTRATPDNRLLEPVSVQVCICEGREFSFALSRIVVDAMMEDVLLLRTIAHEVLDLTRHMVSFRRSQAEREYDLKIQETIGWKGVDVRKIQSDDDADGDENAADATPSSSSSSSSNDDSSIGGGGSRRMGGEKYNGDQGKGTKPAFSFAVYSPLIAVTLSNVKYPLLQVTLSDVVWRDAVFRASRTILMQNQRLHLRVYGKGRWDTVVAPRAVVRLEAAYSWSKKTSTEQLRLHCDGVVVYASHLLLSNMIHINRQWEELHSAILRHSRGVQEVTSLVSSPRTPLFCVSATHRFINTFDDALYLFVGKDVNHGEIVPLPSCTAVDFTLPFNRAEEVWLFLYPRYCISLDDFGRHVRNDEGLCRDMRSSQVLASQLQYGNAVHLVVDDMLVVMSCAQTEMGHLMAAASPRAFSTPSPSEEAAAATAAAVNTGRVTSTGMYASIAASLERADEVGLVIVRVHPQTTLYNGSGMILEVQQYLLGDADETPFGDGFWIVPPNAEYPLSGTCSRLELRAAVDGHTYGASVNILSPQSGVFLDLHPIASAASSLARRSTLPVSLFIAVRRYAESGSIVVLLLPRMTVLNHIGVPVKLSLWQEELQTERDHGGSSPDVGSGANNVRKSRKLFLWRRLGILHSPGKRLTMIGEQESLSHQGALCICQCCYHSSLFLSLSFSQTGGETVRTEEPVRVCRKLGREVEQEPCLVHMYDSNGSRFYVQVSVFQRTIILSVGLWVVNFTEYPILLTENVVSGRLSAGQMPVCGIPPSQGVPFLIGCRPMEFAALYLKLGLDGSWSNGIPTHLGSHGVVESSCQMVGGYMRSCNYVVQFPRIQEGRPVVLLLTPRWVFVNNTNRRLKIYFEFSTTSKKAAVDKTPFAKNTQGAATAAVAGGAQVSLCSEAAGSLAPVTLRPGEHHFSCIGMQTGNRVSFEDMLEDTVPSVTSLSHDGVRHTDFASFYQAHRTASMSVDGPGHAAFNLWASLKHSTSVPSVAHGKACMGRASAPTLSATATSSSSSSSVVSYSTLDSSNANKDIAFVTGRLSVTVQHTNNVLSVVINNIHATNLSIQNRTRGESIAVRQKDYRHCSIIPPCQNRFFLLEDHRNTDPVVSLHVLGRWGAWFEVNFARGMCQVQRHSISSAAAGVLSPFHVQAFTSARDARNVTILLTDETIPLHAAFGSVWRTGVSRTLSVASLEMVWLMGNRFVGSNRPHLSLQLRDVQLRTFNTGNTRTISVMVRQLQVVDARERATTIFHRATLANPSAGEDHGGRILAWGGKGEEVLQHELHAMYAAIESPSGVTRVTELSCKLSPFAVNISDHLVVALWQEYSGLLSLFADGGRSSRGAARTPHALPLVSWNVFSQELVKRIHRDSGSAAVFAFASRTHGANGAPEVLFVDQAHFSRLTLFVTFTRHDSDSLQELLGMYTLMIRTRLRQTEFTWPAFVLENDATTWGLLFTHAQRWLLDGATRQWTKVTRIGNVVDKLKGGTRARVSLAGAPQPMLPEVDNPDDE